MPRSFPGLLAALAAVLALAWAPAQAQSSDLPDGPSHGLIIKLKPLPESAAAAGAPGAQTPRQRLAAIFQGTRERAQAAAPGLAGAQIRPVGRAHLLRWDQPLAPEQARQLAEALRSHPEVESVDFNTRERRLDTRPGDPRYRDQWWLQEAGSGRAGVPRLPAAWDLSTGVPVSGQPFVPVAVLDTGALFDHPDLQGKWLPGYDFVSGVAAGNDGDGRDPDASDPGDWISEADARQAVFGGCEVADSSWHGTLIAGQIAALANNGIGGAGVNWEARIVPVRIAGKCGAEVVDIVDGMRWAAGLPVCRTTDADGRCTGYYPPNPYPARILNLSFGGSASCNATYQEAIDDIRAVGAVLVAAANNDSSPQVGRPANCRHVIAVAALNRDGFKATYSNFGPEITVATVGGDPRSLGRCGTLLGDDGLLTTGNLGRTSPGEHGYEWVSGTSFSTPVVSGVASLMLARHPGLTVDQLIAGLRASARPHVAVPKLGTCASDNVGRCECTTSTCGAGILDAPEALAYAANPTGYQPPDWPRVTIDHAGVDACAGDGPDNDGGSPPDQDGSGGGALDGAWLAGLLALAAGLAGWRRRVAA